MRLVFRNSLVSIGLFESNLFANTKLAPNQMSNVTFSGSSFGLISEAMSFGKGEAIDEQPGFQYLPDFLTVELQGG